jgi:argininosuccinate lyase
VSSALWAGRLAGGLDPAVLDFTASLEVDRRLLPFDLEASAAHARMLGRQGLIPAEKAEQICAALATVEIEPDATDEDVHSAIERLLG